MHAANMIILNVVNSKQSAKWPWKLINALLRLKNTRSIYKCQLYFYILAMNKSNKKIIPSTNCIKKK